MTFRANQIKHNRILDLRKKIQNGWTMESLMNFCLIKLEVSKPTAKNYIDEAAEPFRKKFQEKLNVSK